MPVGRPEMPGTRQGAEEAERQGSGRTDGRGCGEAGAGATAETGADSEGAGAGAEGAAVAAAGLPQVPQPGGGDGARHREAARRVVDGELRREWTEIGRG